MQDVKQSAKIYFCADLIKMSLWAGRGKKSIKNGFVNRVKVYASQVFATFSFVWDEKAWRHHMSIMKIKNDEIPVRFEGD